MTTTVETVGTAAYITPSHTERWVDEHGDFLYRFAVSRLHDAVTAEDLVQETLLAGLRSRQTFANCSTERTWLTGILKHKIADHYRTVFRSPILAGSVPLDESDAVFFNSNGHWTKPDEAAAAFDRAELARSLRSAVAALPKRLAIVFTLREIDGLETEEICRLISISPNNLHLMLHRARLHLRRILIAQAN
jgi:RNA polymerase sigma-70 factor (ECF subfamily)